MVGTKAAATFSRSVCTLDRPPPPYEYSTFAKAFMDTKRGDVLIPQDESGYETWVGDERTYRVLLIDVDESMGWEPMPHVPVSDADQAIRGFVIDHPPQRFNFFERSVSECRADVVPYCYITLELKCHIMALVCGTEQHKAGSPAHV